MKHLTERQLVWFTQLRLKEADFIIGKKINYQPAVHDFIIDKAMCGLTDYQIALTMRIKPQVLYNWLKIYPTLKNDLDAVRKIQIEHAHKENAFGTQVTTETVTKKDGEGNVIQTVTHEKQQPINTISLDRLAQKYAPDLAPKEVKEVDIDIKVKMIDFSKLERAIDIKDIIEGEAIEVVESEQSILELI